jgi:medium-chain acyl-[acyl-carrier-protein] hydrolase
MSQAPITSTLESWIPWHKPNLKSRIRLFCFPFAGAGALIFHAWPDRLPAEVEVCPVQLPGRGTRLKEPPFTRLPPLVEALAQALIPLLDKPFAFFGHSLGALVSFELARRIRRESGLLPVRLFVSACDAPEIPHRGRAIHDLPKAELLTELRRLNGTPSELLDHEELMEIALPLLRADFAIYETYLYSTESPLDCPISAFGGLQDRRVLMSNLEAWRSHTNVSFSLQRLPGDHFFLKDSPFLPALSRELKQSL